MSRCSHCVRHAVRGAVGLLQAAARAGRAPERVILERRRLCRSCPHASPCGQWGGRACRCDACGCFIRAKTSNASEACPLGRWDAHG